MSFHSISNGDLQEACDDRPTKRLKTSTPATVKTRGITACDKCRTRKTKCDNLRPSCGYCIKNRLQCVYSDDGIAAPWEEIGEQILGAISDLSTLVKGQRTQQPASSANEATASRLWRNATTSPFEQHTSFHGGAPAAVPNNSNDMNDASGFPDRAPLKAAGTETVLQWSILGPFRSSDCLFADKNNMDASSTPVPDLGHAQLLCLADKYIAGVHSKNPILELPELKQMIFDVAENGLDWSTRTCLVTLVCAIGAVTQRYQGRRRNPSHIGPGSGDGVLLSDYQSDAQLSLQFWNLAAKRLGLALGQDTVRGVQCLCLAGIFYMHHLQPLQAWKYFSLAGAAWYSVNLLQSSDNDVFRRIDGLQSFTSMQSLYFTIWKSECEMKVELDVPGPILDHIDFPYAFPLPPESDPASPSHEIEENERTWYYYLAEIAIRHLLTRLLRAWSSRKEAVTSGDVKRMVAHAALLNDQIHDWHASLPPVLRFDIPDGFALEPHPDDLCHILRHRYLSYREFVCRPFVKLCVESPLHLEPQLRYQVTDLASQGVRLCMIRLSQFAPFLHQGTWYELRNFATSALVLKAIHLAKQCSWLSGAHDIVLPGDWEDRLSAAINTYPAVWDVNAGGVLNIGRLVQAVLK